jgi:hypothetical protein
VNVLYLCTEALDAKEVSIWKAETGKTKKKKKKKKKEKKRKNAIFHEAWLAFEYLISFK